ncbi:hypothetical protein PROFUN_07202 [Planoprotostelium fungivorum]|uniref:Uncharacterized protein n=1 Tax=Planoprotostelium fungivorum TaxID=1890364 RepID=A0A2P6NMD8_9EUKA|nr:hypothetical protein PROFUN_07202 [Planoprotostelium fungivorum]
MTNRIKVDKFTLPTPLGWFTIGMVFFAYYVLLEPEPIAPLDIFSKILPMWFQTAVIFGIPIIHIAELFIFTMPLLKKHKCGEWNSFLWIGSGLLEGGPAYLRYKSLIPKNGRRAQN